MTCAEIRSLLPFRPVSALEEDEVDGVDAHLAGCQDCSRIAQSYDAAFETVGEPRPGEAASLPEGMFEKIAARVALPVQGDAAPAGQDLSIALVCSFCHDQLSREQACYCASCLAPHHDDCFRSHGRCSAYGCEETRTVRPRLESANAPAPPSVARPRSRRAPVLAFAGLLLGGGAMAALTLSEKHEPMTVGGTRSRDKVETRSIDEFEVALTAPPRPPLVSVPSEAPVPATPAAAAPSKKRVDFPIVLDDVPLERLLEVFSESWETVVASTKIHGRVSAQIQSETDFSYALERIAHELKCRVVDVGSRSHALVPRPQADWDALQGDVRGLLKELCLQSGKNVILAPDVQGTMHGSLRGLGWRRAFDTVIETCGLECVEHDGIVVVAHHNLGGMRSQPFTTDEVNQIIEGIPERDVDLDLENATIAQAASEIARAAGVAIDGLVPASEARVTIRVRKARWWDMLCYVAWEGNFGIEQPAHGLFRLRPKLPHDPKKEVSIHCHHALAPVLFQLLARHGDRNFVIAPDVAGAIVDVELVGASYDAALEAVVDAYGFDVERSQTGILMVTVNPNVKIVRPDASPCDGTVSYGDGIRAKVGALGAVLYDPRELDASEVLMDTEIANSKVAQQRQRHVGDVFECRTDADKDGVHQVGRCKAKVVAIHERSVDVEIDGKESASLEIGK